MNTKIEKIHSLGSTMIDDPLQLTINTRKLFNQTFNKINIAANRNSLPSDYLSMLKVVNRGRVACKVNRHFNMTVSENLVERALLFLDSLSKELLRRKFKINFSQSEKLGYEIFAMKSNEKIYFKLIEGYKYQPISNKGNERSVLDKLLYINNEPKPTGRLAFVINEGRYQGKRNWQDGVMLIESKIADIILAFENLVHIQKKSKIKEGVNNLKLMEDAKLYAEREFQRVFENSIFEQAVREAHEFKVYQELELYLKVIEDRLIEEHGYINDHAKSWIQMVKNKVESQNSVNKRIKELSNCY